MFVCILFVLPGFINIIIQKNIHISQTHILNRTVCTLDCQPCIYFGCLALVFFCNTHTRVLLECTHSKSTQTQDTQ